MAEGEQVTVRMFIEWLRREASALPAGLDAPVNLSICNGKGDQFIDQVDVSHWFIVHRATMARTGEGWVLIRGHWHPGKSPGEYHAGAEDEDWDPEIEKLMAGDEDPDPGPEPGDS